MRDWLMAVLWYRSEWFRLFALYVAENGWPSLSHWMFVNTPLGYCLRLEALRRGDLSMAIRITEMLNESG